MPTLLDVQHAVYRSVVERDDGLAAQYIVADTLAPEARLSIYRNTFIGSLTTALRLSYPAVHRLVGLEFFESAARIFIEAQPPHSAYLDEYGANFPEFLANFEPAASVSYLAGVARLEWMVSRALHAPDVKALDLSRLAGIDPLDHGRIAFAPHPSLGLVRADHPVDAVWRAVLAQDDGAMAAIDLESGPVWLLVQRRGTDVNVTRITHPEWCFMAELCASRPLQAAIDAVPETDATILLADHLAAGHFIGFELTERARVIRPVEASA
jgi:hypothetical protein